MHLSQTLKETMPEALQLTIYPVALVVYASAVSLG